MEKTEVIKLLKEMQPDQFDLDVFDLSKKSDHIYCVEWGMRKQAWIENGVYQKQIDKLEK